MLAPRKTLWSTPLSAVDELQTRIPLQANDCVCDIGCGDGRILLEWAKRHAAQHPTKPVTFIGIDIDPERIQNCQHSLQDLGFRNNNDNVRVQFHCANALESTHLFEKATVFFLYLIPRGLKLIVPVLLQHKQQQQQQQQPSPLHVVSYMSKLPSSPNHNTIPPPVDRALLAVEHQPEAAWPLYFYIL